MTLVILAVGLQLHASARTNRVALASAPKPVTVVLARSGEFQAIREYVGATDPWVEAKIGPQFISAYVETVRFRPGARVHSGEVLATLDCRYASAGSREIAARARALARRQGAIADEADRIAEMVRGGFASRNDIEMARARAGAEQEEVRSQTARLTSMEIQVHDCVLRAPFDGDVVGRFADPGAFVRPGEPVLVVADRSIIRVIGDAPEDDYSALEPGAPVEVEIAAVKHTLDARIARRTPAADRSTRTIHIEIDVTNRSGALPSGATALIRLPVGKPEPATTLPLQAGEVQGKQATVFLVSGETVSKRQVEVLGERDGLLYLRPGLPAEAHVVLEGRSLLRDGDRVRATVENREARR